MTAPNSEPLDSARIHEILARLDRPDGKFPEAEVAEVIVRREEFIPLFLRILEEAADNPERVASDTYAMAHIFAAYLLAYFREPRALPFLVRICSLPGEMPFDLFGDVITGDMARILASVSGGETAPIRALVESGEINEFVRATALRTLQTLVIEGIRSREELLEYFSHLFRTLKREGNETIWGSLAIYCAEMSFTELREQVKEVWDQGLIDPTYVTWEELEEDYSREPGELLERLRRRNPLLIDDPARQMSWMQAFEPPRPRLPPAPLLAMDDREPDGWPATFRRPEPKVGRNDPCPCGSGKKYKKCCGK